MKRYIGEHKIQFFIIDATKIAVEIGLGNRTNSIMQSTFFRLAKVIPYEKAIEEMKKAVKKTYGRKGEEIVNMNAAPSTAEVKWNRSTCRQNGPK